MLTSRGPRDEVPVDRFISSIISDPNTLATVDWCRLFFAA